MALTAGESKAGTNHPSSADQLADLLRSPKPWSGHDGSDRIDRRGGALPRAAYEAEVRTHEALRVRPPDIFFGFLRLLSRDIAIAKCGSVGGKAISDALGLVGLVRGKGHWLRPIMRRETACEGNHHQKD